MTSLLAAITMMMTPGGTASMSPNGWVTACTGSVRTGSVWTSSCHRHRLGVRGLNARVWEDGSFRLRHRRTILFYGCIVGKGCED